MSETAKSGGSLPATYEIDVVTGEASGIVHPYCSTQCQRDDLERLEGAVSVEPDGGEMFPADSQCEGCGRLL